MAHVNEFDPKLMDLRAALAEVRACLSIKLPKSLRSTEKYDETEQSLGGSASAEAERRTWHKCPFTQQG
jgi:hypothetical protein